MEPEEPLDEGMRLFAEVEALKIAVTAIVKILPDDVLKQVQELASDHWRIEQAMLEATTTPDAQIAQVETTLTALLTPAVLQKPRPSA